MYLVHVDFHQNWSINIHSLLKDRNYISNLAVNVAIFPQKSNVSQSLNISCELDF